MIFNKRINNTSLNLIEVVPYTNASPDYIIQEITNTINCEDQSLHPMYGADYDKIIETGLGDLIMIDESEIPAQRPDPSDMSEEALKWNLKVIGFWPTFTENDEEIVSRGWIKDEACLEVGAAIKDDNQNIIGYDTIKFYFYEVIGKFSCIERRMQVHTKTRAFAENIQNAISDIEKIFVGCFKVITGKFEFKTTISESLIKKVAGTKAINTIPSLFNVEKIKTGSYDKTSGKFVEEKEEVNAGD